MGREIKFRVWSNRSKSMINTNECEIFIDFNGGMYTTSTDEYVDLAYCEVEDAVLMQYTGLKDKNGKEVYEGDIVKARDKVYKVIWDMYMWNLENFYAGYYDYPTIAFSEDLSFEVIGNIYENSDLLGK